MSTEKRSQIYEIADQLLREGVKPTQQNVRERLGSGSLTTINRALNEWWEQLGSRLEAQTQGFDLPDPVVKQVNRLWSEALSYADKASNQRVENLQKKLVDAQAELASIDSRYTSQIIDLNVIINQLRVDISSSDDAIKELAGTIISVFFGRLSDSIAISKASVPFATAIQYFVLVYFAKFSSKSNTDCPPMKDEFSIIYFIDSSISFFMDKY